MSEATASANPQGESVRVALREHAAPTPCGKADAAPRRETSNETTKRHQIRSAEIRAAALGRLLVGIAPNKGSAITLKVTNKSGFSCRATFSHASVLFVLRRALAEAQASALAVGQPKVKRLTSSPVRKAASA
jgi:hypothetical protein